MINSQIIQDTSEGSKQTAHMGRLVRAFAGRTYHSVGNFMLLLVLYLCVIVCLFVVWTRWLQRFVTCHEFSLLEFCARYETPYMGISVFENFLDLS